MHAQETSRGASYATRRKGPGRGDPPKTYSETKPERDGEGASRGTLLLGVSTVCSVPRFWVKGSHGRSPRHHGPQQFVHPVALGAPVQAKDEPEYLAGV
jgi:hypothetical protein